MKDHVRIKENLFEIVTRVLPSKDRDFAILALVEVSGQITPQETLATSDENSRQANTAFPLRASCTHCSFRSSFDIDSTSRRSVLCEL